MPVSGVHPHLVSQVGILSPSLSSSSPGQVLLAILALAVGGFSIGTGEFVIMGLLPDVAHDLGIDIPTAGHLISSYALGVVIGAPVLAVLGARWPWRRLLIALMGGYAVGNFLTVIAPSYETVLISRFLAGLPHGTYFGVAALVAARLVPPHRRAQAVAYVLDNVRWPEIIGTVAGDDTIILVVKPESAVEHVKERMESIM